MSLIDMILEQRLILVSIGAVLVPLLLAVVLWLAVKFRAASVKRARRKALRQEARAAASVSAAESQLDAAPAKLQPAQPRKAAQAVQPLASQAQAKSAPVVQTTAMTNETSSSESRDNPVSTAMQDILSTVFSDEEKMARYEVLLSGLDNVPASELAMLCDRVAEGLRAHHPVALQGKEFTR